MLRAKRSARAPARLADSIRPPPPKRSRVASVATSRRSGRPTSTSVVTAPVRMTTSSTSTSSTSSATEPQPAQRQSVAGGESVIALSTVLAAGEDNLEGVGPVVQSEQGVTLDNLSANARPKPNISFQVRALGFAIPSAIKQKVWDGEFIDLAHLLNDNSIQLLAHSHQQNAEMVFTLNEAGSMVLRPAGPPRKKIDTLDKWLSAFHVFMAIFLEKHPNRAAELLKYAETIRLASVQFPGTGWHAYDEQFRLRRVADQSSSSGK